MIRAQASKASLMTISSAVRHKTASRALEIAQDCATTARVGSQVPQDQRSCEMVIALLQAVFSYFLNL